MLVPTFYIEYCGHRRYSTGLWDGGAYVIMMEVNETILTKTDMFVCAIYILLLGSLSWHSACVGCAPIRSHFICTSLPPSSWSSTSSTDSLLLPNNCKPFPSPPPLSTVSPELKYPTTKKYRDHLNLSRFEGKVKAVPCNLLSTALIIFCCQEWMWWL